MSREIYIDPSYEFFNSDKLFDLSDPKLNRDDQLLPFHRMREDLQGQGATVRTADSLAKSDRSQSGDCDYYSLGILHNFERVHALGAARLAAFVIMEPPVVQPELYRSLPRLTTVFDKVYVHNTVGDGYSLEGVEIGKLFRFYWPIPYSDVLNPYWERTARMKRIVVINGSHNPHGRDREQYSLRIQAMADLSRIGVVDLYGNGWNIWWSRRAMWLPYWRNRRAIMSIYKGSCASKFEVLTNYEFCLCFENMRMDGYITEKIFDCLYAGTVPLYLGAPDIMNYVPADCFVDCRMFSTWTEMWRYVANIPVGKIQAMKIAGRDFIRSDQVMQFYHSVKHICEG